MVAARSPLIELSRPVQSCAGLLPAGHRGRLCPTQGWGLYDLHSEVPLDGIGVPHDAVLFVVTGEGGKETLLTLLDWSRLRRRSLRCSKCGVNVADPGTRDSPRWCTPERRAKCIARRTELGLLARQLRAAVDAVAAGIRVSRSRPCRLRSALRTRRDAVAAVARDRHARLASGAESAASWERALLGALLVRPRLVRALAKAHPPAWWVDAGAREAMKALFCASSGGRTPTADDLIDTLERHGTLDLTGGADAVRALTAPRPELDRALRELDDLLSRLAPAKRDQIARAEDLDDLDGLIDSGLEPTAASEAITEGGLAESPAAPAQLDLFEERPQEGSRRGT